MNKQELIEWKNAIEAMNSKKYVAIPTFDIINGDMIDVSELSVSERKKSTKNVVESIKLYYEKSILSASSSEVFDVANLYISIYLIAPKNGEIEDRRKFISECEFVEDCILVEPAVTIVCSEELVDIGDEEYKKILPNYVVSYKDFFEQMSNEGFDFDVCPFEELKTKVKNIDVIDIATCIINFTQNISEKDY